MLIGNGEELPCSFLCKNVDLCLDGQLFTVDLFVIPLNGAELVLGVQWLKTLGPVLTDYNNLTMSFTMNNQTIKISGSPKPSPTEASMHQLKRLASTQSLDTILQFHLLTPSPDIDNQNNHPPALENLLTNYSPYFPNQMPYHHQDPPTIKFLSYMEKTLSMYAHTATHSSKNKRLRPRYMTCSCKESYNLAPVPSLHPCFWCERRTALGAFA